jgi:CRP/FNR family transcriptional regulator, anaerobic regulatory protein
MANGAPHMSLRDELLEGQREFRSCFSSNLPRLLKAGDSLDDADSSNASRPSIYRLRTGWACQLHQLPDGRQAILEVYLPGDVIGLDAAFRTRPIDNVVALTSGQADAAVVEHGLRGLMTHRHTALYVTWLLGKRQRRTDELLAAISNLDARGRLAMMILDFYKRLCKQRLISSPVYNLPLTQSQIASYLGLTVVHVNRVLGALREQRIVNLERHCITIIDLERLTTLAQTKRIARSPHEIELSSNEPIPVRAYS